VGKLGDIAKIKPTPLLVDSSLTARINVDEEGVAAGVGTGGWCGVL